MFSPSRYDTMGTTLDLNTQELQACQQITPGADRILADVSIPAYAICEDPDVVLPYSNRAFSDVFDPQHGQPPQTYVSKTHGDFADLQGRWSGRSWVPYPSAFEAGLEGSGGLPESYSVLIDPGTREYSRRPQYHGVLHDPGEGEYDQMPTPLGGLSNPREGKYELMLDGERLLRWRLLESKSSTLPANPTSGDKTDPTLQSDSQYNGNTPSRSADARPGFYAPQALDSGLLVFDSSMKAMGHRQRNRKSHADKEAARHLRRTGGACPRHKVNKKKCRCRTTSGSSKYRVDAGTFAEKHIPLEVPEMVQEPAAVDHNPQGDPRQGVDDPGMICTPPKHPYTTATQELQTPIPHPDKESHKGASLPDGSSRGVVEHRLVFTCPFLYFGCKFVAFSSAEWSAHLGDHERCRPAPSHLPRALLLQ